MHYVLHAELNATVPQRRKKAKHTGIKSTPPPFVALLLPHTSTSNSSCFICRRPGLKLTVVSTAEKNSVFLRKKVLISYGSRWCVKLLPESKFTTEALERLPVYSDITNINIISITEIILYLWEIALENEQTGIDFVNKINFHDSTISSLPDSLKLL